MRKKYASRRHGKFLVFHPLKRAAILIFAESVAAVTTDGKKAPRLNTHQRNLAVAQQEKR
jgi:hypothetical protein